MSYVRGLKCREKDCGRTYPTEPLHICEFCFGKLEVDYDYGAIKDRTAAEHAGNNEGIAVAISPDSGFKYTSYFMDILGDEGNPQV